MTTIRPGRLEWAEYVVEPSGPLLFVARGPFGLDVVQVRGARWRWRLDQRVSSPDTYATHLDAIAAAEAWAVQDTIDRMHALAGGERRLRAEKDGEP